MKKNILLIIVGMLIGSIGVYASTLINSNQVSYKDTTVDLALNDLFDDSLAGKNKIAEAITNKGIDTVSTDSYDTMVANIENISTGNPNLRYDETTGYIQALDNNGEWANIKHYETLPIPASLSLFSNGNEQVATTGGWTSSGYVSRDVSVCSNIVNNGDRIHIPSLTGSSVAVLGTQNLIDFTPYNKLFITGIFTGKKSPMYWLYISNNKNIFNVNYKKRFDETVITSLNTPITIELDVSDVSGEGFLSISTYIQSQWYIIGDISEIWLEI